MLDTRVTATHTSPPLPFRQHKLGEVARVPVSNVFQSIAVMVAPVALGMWIRRRSERWAGRVERAGSISGMAVLALLIAVGLIRNGDVLRTLSMSMLAGAAGLGLSGMLLGWFSAKLGGLSRPERRAVCFETGIQNSPLALALIIASFPSEQHDDLLVIPMLYALLVLINGALVTLGFAIRTGSTRRATRELFS